VRLIRHWARKLRERPQRVRQRKPRVETVHSAGTQAQFRVTCGADGYWVSDPDQLEEEQRRRFLELLRPDDVVYDVGTHIGIWTVFSAQRVPEGQVHGFEPNAENRAQVEANAQLNGLQNVSVHAQAIGDRTHEADFALFKEDRSARGSLVPDQPPDRTIRVEVLALDDAPVHLGIGQPNAIKLDIEGAEGLALEGANRLLAGPALRVIQVEVHEQLGETGWSMERIVRHLADAGFDLVHRFERLDQVHCLFRRE